jgi:3-phenylpropionate/cinnamic acid dioxygenase small subunit
MKQATTAKGSDRGAVPHALAEEIEDFVRAEAELLDEGKLTEWVALFADDGKYWMPSQPDQTDPLAVPSIFYDDRDILAIRVRRVLHPTNLAQSPLPRMSHVLDRMRVTPADGGLFEARTRMIVVEYRDPDGQRVFGGKSQHLLRQENGRLRIVLKRVDILNCDAPHSFITLPM